MYASIGSIPTNILTHQVQQNIFLSFLFCIIYRKLHLLLSNDAGLHHQWTKYGNFNFLTSKPWNVYRLEN